MTDPQAPPPDVADLVRRLQEEAEAPRGGPGNYGFTITYQKRLLREAADALAPQLEKFEKENPRPNGAEKTEVGSRSLPLPPINWHPIDTAPKDGTVIDVWCQSLDGVEQWRETNCTWYAGPQVWVNAHGRCGCVTHWMPLPAPPAEGR